MASIEIPAAPLRLPGELEVSSRTRGVVIFAHGSGSSRHSPRNQYVAQVLRESNIGTLLFDLLTPREDQVYETRFNIQLLTQRLLQATEWLVHDPRFKELPLGYFGASTGAAAALWSAAELGNKIHAVVSRGGRPDLAMEVLSRVVAPTLLIVGGEDHTVIELNQLAYAELRCVKELAIVPGATHLFEEPGRLEEAARLAAEWFARFLP